VSPQHDSARWEQGADIDDPAAGLIELLADWTWEQDPEFRFISVSIRGPGSNGFDPVAFFAHPHWETQALNVDAAAWEAHCEQRSRHETFRDLQIQCLTEEGRVVWIALSGQPVFDRGGAFLGYRGIGRDVTAQKRTEELRRLEHAVAAALAAATRGAEGLREALRLVCELEGWDAGRCFGIDEASGELELLEGWYAHEPAIGQLLKSSRVLWQAGKPVWSTDLPRRPGRPRERGGKFATLAFPVQSQGRPIAMLAFSGQRSSEPDATVLEALPAIGSLFGQFLQREQAELSLRESEARFRGLTQLSSDFFWESDAEHRLVSIVHGPNYAAPPVGYGMVGKTPWELASAAPDQAGWQAHKATLDDHLPFRDFEIARPLPEGGMRYFAVSGQPRFDADGTFLGYRGVGRDVTEIAAARQRIASLAYSDPLTGLANRVSLAPALEQAIERARRHGTKLAGVFIDLDGFKQINDRHGHAAGDAFLVEVAQRLRRSVRASDLVARLGGDEFFVVLEEVQDTPAVERVLGKLIDALRRPYPGIGEAQRRISATLGVSLFPDDASDAATLMENADEAMYTAKQAGKNAYCLYSSTRKPPPPSGGNPNGDAAPGTLSMA
jgi:diguanylate cyclase (GGDEF)-like protein/PAS domain S-box-containing protein